MELRAGESTCVPRARSAGAGSAGRSLAGLPPLPAPGLSASGGSGTAGRGRGGVRHREASHSAEHPRVPPAAPAGRWQRAGPGQSAEPPAGPGAELGRARLRAGGRHSRPRRGEVPISAVKGWKGK